MHWGIGCAFLLEPIMEPGKKRFKNSSTQYGYHPEGGCYNI